MVMVFPGRWRGAPPPPMLQHRGRRGNARVADVPATGPAARRGRPPFPRPRARRASVAATLAEVPMPSIPAVSRAGLACLLLAMLAACNRAPAPAAAPAVAPAPVDDAAAGRTRADVAALADDRMQGRRTGTPGFDRAADYVAGRMRVIGLQPAGDDGTYFQRVPLLSATRVAEGARLQVLRHDRTITLRFADQFLPAPDFTAAERSVRAPAVFVGQGVVAPERGHDDLAGLDLHGKVAVLFGGAPAAFDQDLRAIHGAPLEKLRALAARGAVGAVFVDSAQDEARAPWARQAAAWRQPQLRLRAADGRALDVFPQLRVVATVSAAAADLLFDGSGHTAAELAAAVRAGKATGFALPVSLSLAARSAIATLDSRNVVGALPGSDPRLAGEGIVLSAHLDHLGEGPAAGGDRIYNGALDNALGVAVMLEAARIAHAAGPAKRPLLFLASTAEEQGLLGAQWFALHPHGRAVADINLDMPMLLAPTRDAVVLGAGHSSLQAAVQQAARQVPMPLSGDPFPEESMFTRSDQYAFVRAGIPALYLDGGTLAAESSTGKAADAGTVPLLAQRDFLRRCYHQPCDDSRQPIQYGDAARLATLAARIGLAAGNAAQPPRWNAGDPFGTRFGVAAGAETEAPR
jgi:Zn-dependent M28 family amino/carboxypeptidase